MLIIAGHLEVEPDSRADYLTDHVAVIEAARAAPGCLEFSLTADPIEPGKVLVYERWISDEELIEFRGSGPDSETQARILDAQVSKYRIESVEDP